MVGKESNTATMNRAGQFSRDSRTDMNRKKVEIKKEPKTPTKKEKNGTEEKPAPNDIDEETGQKKFTGRCRLFVGNIPSDTKEDEFRSMFSEFGEVSEVFLNPSRGFGFIRLDTREHAEKAKTKVDGQQKKGRMLRVRFATHGAALKVKYLPPHVSNELLAEAFGQFGDVERAVVVVDDRGKPTGDGIVEFARKPGAISAIKSINSGVFVMGRTPRPIAVEALEQKDEEDGHPEKFINKNPDFLKEREHTPRFASPGSFEHDFGQKWKELYRMEEEQKKQLERQMEEACMKLEMEMESAAHEHQAMLLRQDLMRRQEELNRLEEVHRKELEKKMQMKQQELEMRRRDERYPPVAGGMHDRGLMERGLHAGMEERRRMELGQRGNPDAYGNHMRHPHAGPGGIMNQPGMRQSRFDQPPTSMGYSSMAEAQHHSALAGGQGDGPQMAGGMRAGRDPMMDSRAAMQHAAVRGAGPADHRGPEDYYDAKRPRRY